MYANADSLTNKMEELKTYANQYQADLILITESLAKNTTVDNNDVNTINNVNNINSINNVYNIDDFNCLECNFGRGVCLFYRNTLNVTTNDSINKMYKPSIFINIKTHSKPLNVGLVYRSPSNDNAENNKMNNQLNFASKQLKNLVIFGDFNHPSIDWEYTFCKKNEEHIDSQFLFEVIKMNSNQLITNTTHHKPNCKATLIDLILTKNPEIISSITHNPPIGKSYHDCITANLRMSFTTKSTEVNNTEKIFKPNFNKANFSELNKFFDSIEWEESLKDKNVEESWEFIKSNIYKGQQNFVPNKVIKNVKKRINPVSMDNDLHTLLKNKRYLFKIYKKYNTQSALNNYNTARNRVSYKIRLMKKSKECDIAKNIKKNPKAFYQYVSSKIVKKEGVYELMNDKGDLTNNDKEKCDIINKFFSSVFTKEDINDIPDFNYDTDSFTPLESCQITLNDMEKALFNLNPTKSPGPDGFHPKLLKSCSTSLANPLKILFEKTLAEGILPEDFKIAEVRPIFKKGVTSNPGNYRPVSLTSVICKLFETFIKNALNIHLIQNNILSDVQFGFVSGRNTISQLLTTINDWMLELDNNVCVDAAYMDFRKAFDTVPHQRLIKKLQSYKINGPILNWIISFLTNRSQFVKINNSVSENLNVTSGVPQGSVLGPTLFIYFINDLPNVVKDNNVKIFADDTKVYKSINDDNDNKCLQGAIDEMFLWTQKWLLKFNKDKCKVLHLGRNNPHHKYSIGEEDDRVVLETTDLEKDLGVHIDPNLDFKNHIKTIVKKASFLTYKILKNFTFRDSNIIVPLFKTLIRPILEYGNTVWYNGLKKCRDKIENVQRKLTKHIKGLSNTPYEERLKYIKLPSMEYRQIRGDLIQVFKIAHNYYDPITTKSLFQFSDNQRLRGHNFKILKQRTIKSKYSNFFTNRVVNRWNKLPSNVVNATSINNFKNQLDAHYKNIMYKINIPEVL